MANTLAHRGPNAEGYWINEKTTVGLAHRRLSIIDLSDQAAQPFLYLNRYSMVYNGEIYNYIELKEILQQKGYLFTSQSDTEVLLAAYDCWKEKCLQHFDGMFAFAIWDEKEQTLFAARDRLGEKPFYYCYNETQLFFASEMKALWAAGIEKSINEKLVYNYLTLGYVQNPDSNIETAYRNITKLPPAHFLQYHLHNNTINTSLYWQVNTKNVNNNITEKAAIEKFQQLLIESVKKRLRSDVAIGTSLSGGLDSSTIASYIYALQPTGVTFKTFSAVFPDFLQNEQAYIAVIKNKFAIQNFQITPTANTLINNFEKLCYHQEEPFQSGSIYAQYCVFELAKQHNVKVLLDGQGADETLAGYHKYYHWYWQELYNNNRSHLKNEIAAARQIQVISPWNWKNKLAARFPQVAAQQLQYKEIKKAKNNSFIHSDFVQEHFYNTSLYKPIIRSLNDVLGHNCFQLGLEELLRYADRNSMAHSIEVRLPFLNHELVEFIFSLPAHFKINNGYTKWILRKSMENILPDEITWRKNKIGFEPPQKEWLQQNALQDYLHEAKKKLVKKNILTPQVLIKKNQPQSAHAADNFDWRYLVMANLI